MSYNNAIQQVLRRFDFATVHNVMTFLDWGWGHPAKVPSIGQLYQEAERQLQRAAASETGYCASGGLAASCRNGCASLTFELAGWDEDTEDNE